MSSSIAVDAPPIINKKRRKTRRWGRWLFLLGGVAAIVGMGTWYWQSLTPPTTTAPMTVAVTKGDIEVTIEGSGAVSAIRSGSVPFQQSGQVTEVLVKAGESVTQGQLLARVENQELGFAVERAEAELAAAEAKLAELRAGTLPEELTIAQASLANAQAQLAAAQVGADSADIRAAEATLAAAQATLDALYDGATAEALIEAQVALEDAEAAVRQAQFSYDQVAQQPNVAGLPQALELETATHAYEAAQARYNALLAGPTASEVASATAQVREAEAALAQVRSPASAAEIAAAEAEVRRAEAELAMKEAGNRSEVITAQEAGVRGAAIALAEAELALAQSEVRAPYAGVVAEVEASVGTFVSAGDGAVTVMDTSVLQLDLSVNEIDVSQLAVGQPVQLNFDALPTATLTGTVTAIAPIGTAEQGLVYYPVQVAFDAGASEVKVGMTTNATIVVETHVGVLQVPSGALRGSGEVQLLEVLYGEGQTPIILAVETGATNGTMTEIVRCLDTGDLCLQEGDTLALEMEVNRGTGTGNGGEGGDMMFLEAMPAGAPAGGPVMIQRTGP
jgi:HlyD family secretion protein